MREELKGLQPQLEQTSLETQELIKIIERDSEDVAVVKRAVEADEAVAKAAADDAQAIKVSLQISLPAHHIK
jgi:dynein heavy chain, axonemal